MKDDTISRQAAIDAIENEQKKIMRSEWAIEQAKFSAMSEIRALIVDLPSASTEKIGHWRHYEGMLICSECGAEFYDDIMEYCGDDVPKCCPDCGTKMEVEE